MGKCKYVERCRRYKSDSITCNKHEGTYYNFMKWCGCYGTDLKPKEQKKTIIGIFDDVASGIRYYCQKLHEDIGGEKVDMSGFYLKYKGKKDSFKSSDKRITPFKPFVIPKGDIIFFNLYDSRVNLAALPTLMVCKLLRKTIVGIIHHEKPLEKSFLDRFDIGWFFDYYIAHRKSMKKWKNKNVIYRPMSVYHEKTILTMKECREKLQIPYDIASLTVLFGHIRPYKGIEKFTRKFLKSAGKDDFLLIVGKKWYDIKLPDDYRIKLRDMFVPDEQVGMYLKSADKVAIPYGLEKSAVNYLAKLYDKEVVR